MRWALVGSWTCCLLAAFILTQPAPVIGRGSSDHDAGRASGADVSVSDLPVIGGYATVAGVTGYSIGTTSCNVGTIPLNWFNATADHPVIAQNMYRLKSGRFEQIGMSWVKHAYCATQNNTCASCSPACAGCCDYLGVGCSDPYGSGFNGDQSRLGPRSEINPATGQFPFPPTLAWGQTGDGVYKRVAVPVADLNPAINSGAQYFCEGIYLARDDALSGNTANNASYRPFTVGAFSGGLYLLNVTGATTPEAPAIYAWAAAEPGVTIREIDVPSDGRVLAAFKTTDLGGTWHYELAVFNFYSDRAVQAVRVPTAGQSLTNIAARDIDHHSGEPYSTAAWTDNAGAGGELVWQTETYAANPNANALRWGTLFNYRFDAAGPPVPCDVTLTLFKPGAPSAVAFAGMGPAADGDLNCDGQINVLDINAFVLALSDAAAYATAYPTCYRGLADVNNDASVNVLDINAFVALLAGGN
ncbi:hypothetical protein RAS1_24470 [Phycisphaerae bacterium RAS1]|nr:hypothetical protein RAS1_24470 [Phycisphaerae bacterium RAS1]